MKKIAVLLLLVLALAGCGKKTAMLIVDNQSDWRVVVSITNVKELGKKVDKSLHTIFKRNDPYSNSAHSNISPSHTRHAIYNKNTRIKSGE